MRVRVHKAQERGHTLLVVMMMAGILTAAFGTYLSLTSKENKSVMRSLCWNSALPLAEAGIEEALSHMTRNLSDYSADSWTKNGTNYSKQRSLGDSYYTVTISGSPGELVTIKSTAYSHWVDTNYLSRDLVVIARTGSSMAYPGLVATNIALGGGFMADSYDSEDPFYSTGGAYDPAKAGDKAFIASLTSGFTVSGSSHIYGYVASGPGGNVTAKGAAIVGDRGYRTKGTIQSGHWTNAFVMPIPDVVAPFKSANAPTSGTVDGTAYTYVLSGGNYMVKDLDEAGSSSTMVVSSDSVLYVKRNVSLSKIVFQNGAKLDIYLAGSDITFSPTLEGATSPNFRIFGLPTCTDLSLTSKDGFTGILYAPECTIKAAGGANFSGAIVCASIKCTGSFGFHYDLAAARSYVVAPVQVISWVETY